MLDRKKVNDEIERIVRQHESTFRDCPSEMTVTLTIGSLIRELQAHVDATVAAALGQASGADPIAELRTEFAELNRDKASSNDIVQWLDDWLTERGYPTVLYA